MTQEEPFQTEKIGYNLPSRLDGYGGPNKFAADASPATRIWKFIGQVQMVCIVNKKGGNPQDSPCV